MSRDDTINNIPTWCKAALLLRDDLRENTFQPVSHYFRDHFIDGVAEGYGLKVFQRC